MSVADTINKPPRPDRVSPQDVHATTGPPNAAGRHHLVMPCDSDTEYVFLRLPDRQHGWCNIPFGAVSTQKRADAEKAALEQADGESANILVPMIPLVYTEPSADKNEAQFPMVGDRLYIFVAGHLWRELEAAEGGWFQDVNLHYVAGFDGDRRPATGAAIPRLQLPFRVDGGEPEIRIAVAKTPWSWARINALGGMHPSDFRRQESDARLPSAAESDAARQRLEARTQRVDLTGYERSFEGAAPAAECAAVEAMGRGADGSDTRFPAMNRRERAAVGKVYLHDPVGVAERLAAHLEALIEDFEGLQHTIKDETDHYDSALKAVSLFFCERVQAQETVVSKGPGGGVPTKRHVNRDAAASHLRDCASHIDETYLRETVLRRSERREYRKSIREYTARLAAFLDDRECQPDNYPGDKLSNKQPDRIAFPAAVCDEAHLPAPDYLRLWQRMLALVNRLNFDPLDEDIDTPDAKDECDAMCPGRWYLDRLVQPEHALNPVLFPTSEQVDATAESYERPGSDPPEKAAKGEFLLDRFAEAALDDGRLAETAYTGAHYTILSASGVSAAWVSVLRRQMDWDEVKATVVRLTKATGRPELVPLRLVRESQSAADVRPLDGGWGFPAGQADGESATGDSAWQRVDDSAGLNRGLREPRATRKSLRALMVRDDSTRSARLTFVGVTEDSAATRQLDEAASATDADPHKAGRLNQLKAARGVISPAAAVFAAINLYSAWNEFRKPDSGLQEESDLFVAAAGTLHASMEAAMALGGDDLPERVARRAAHRVSGAQAAHSAGRRFSRLFNPMTDGGARVLGKQTGLKVTTIAAAGLSVAMGILSIWRGIEALDEGERERGMAQLANGAALIGVGITTLYASSGGWIAALGGPWGVAFILLSIATGVLVAWFSDTDLEHWARYGPFAFDDERFTEDYQGLERKPDEVHERLVQALLCPRVELVDHPPNGKASVYGEPIDFEAQCTMPEFEPGETVVLLDVTRQAVLNNLGPDLARVQESLTPIARQPLEQKGEVIGLRVGFRHDAAEVPRAGHLHYRARLRYLTAGGHKIPADPQVHTKSDDPVATYDEKPGWVYGEMIWRQ